MKGWRSRPPAAHSSHCHRNAGWCWGTNGAVHGARFWADGWVDGWMDGWVEAECAMPLWPYGVLCVRVQTEGVKRGQQPLRAALAVTLVR